MADPMMEWFEEWWLWAEILNMQRDEFWYDRMYLRYYGLL